MSMARPTAAPGAFLDYCARQPSNCGDGAAIDVAAVRRQASQIAWGAAFDLSASSAPAAIAGSTSSKPIDWAAAFKTANSLGEDASVDGGRAAVAPVEVVAASTGETAPLPVLTEALWTRLNNVNRQINQTLIRRSDADGYGAEDYWATPLSDAGAKGAQYGDCEDYVLEKRRALVAAGLPAKALSVAIVTTSWGETHAVLLVATDRGEYVMDNLSSWVLPWTKVAYTWRERQFEGSLAKWGLPAVGGVSETGLMSVASR